MRNRPAQQRAGTLSPRERIWAAIRRFGVPSSDGANGAPFSAVEVAFLAGERIDAVVMPYIRALAKAGYVHPVEPPRPHVQSRCELTRVFLVRDVGVQAPRLDDDGKPLPLPGRERMWLTVRKEKSAFTWREVALRASIEEAPIAESEAQNYLGFLMRAGYLRAVKPNGGRRMQHYEFIRARDTGPRPPMVDREKRVIDGNTGAVMLEGVTHAG